MDQSAAVLPRHSIGVIRARETSSQNDKKC